MVKVAIVNGNSLCSVCYHKRHLAQGRQPEERRWEIGIERKSFDKVWNAVVNDADAMHLWVMACHFMHMSRHHLQMLCAAALVASII
jgi:hypothetical protein